MPLDNGQILHNRYRILNLLGQGGFGAVYHAWDNNLNRACALKENLNVTAEAQRQFSREATLLANLSHPNLPRVTDHFFLPGQGQYLVMDFVEGEDLQTMIDRLQSPMPEAQALAWVGQVCEAVVYLHSQTPPIIHRDIKPANIKITPEGRAMLVDFGIAKSYAPHLQTTLGARAVTPGYSPPEQYGQGSTDVRSDVYSLGATLYKLLTGRDPTESVQRSLGAPLTSPRLLNQAISPAIEQVLLNAMQVLPTQRYQSAAVFKNALRTASQPVQVARISPTAYAQPVVVTPQPIAAPPTPPRRTSWLWIGAGGVLILIVGVVGFVAILAWLVGRGSTQVAGNSSATQTALAQLQISPTSPSFPSPTPPPRVTSPGASPTSPPPTTPPTFPPPPPTTLPPPASPTPVLEAAIVEPYCSMFNQSLVYVKIHQPVTLWWRWDAKTVQQVEDHIAAAIYEILLDGVPIQAERMSEIEYLRDKGWYRVSWFAPVGVLSPGTHRAVRNLSWRRLITDGWNTFGPGGQTETESHYCEIIVR